jgi:hypothetical protein
MKKLILLLVSLIAISCTDNDDNAPIAPVTPFVPVTINPILISKKNNAFNSNGGISEQNLIINDETNWTNLKNLMDAPYTPYGINFCQQYFIETTIDFNSYTVIAAFDKINGNGGHSIDITNITENETNIIVTVQKLLTGNANSVITQPYHIVKIPKAKKPIVFQ